MENLISIRKSWDLLAAAAAAVSALGNTNKDWANMPAAAVEIDQRLSIVEAAVKMDGNISAANITIYAYRRGGPAMRVCSFTATAGAMEVIASPVTQASDSGKYADQITALTGYWYDDIKTADSGGTDGMARVAFDAYGASHLYAAITSITGTGTVEVIISGV
jgi:hypothetical protein